MGGANKPDAARRVPTKAEDEGRFFGEIREKLVTL